MCCSRTVFLNWPFSIETCIRKLLFRKQIVYRIINPLRSIFCSQVEFSYKWDIWNLNKGWKAWTIWYHDSDIHFPSVKCRVISDSNTITLRQHDIWMKINHYHWQIKSTCHHLNVELLHLKIDLQFHETNFNSMLTS